MSAFPDRLEEKEIYRTSSAASAEKLIISRNTGIMKAILNIKRLLVDYFKVPTSKNTNSLVYINSASNRFIKVFHFCLSLPQSVVSIEASGSTG